VVLHRPEVPAWLAAEDLAGVLTYSGGTWEAEAALLDCLARKVPAFAVTSEASRLRAAGLPEEAVFVLEAGMAPRAALGILLVPALLALAPLVSGGGAWIRSELEAALAALEEEVALWKTGRALPGRDPAVLAVEVAGKPAVIYAPDETFHPVAVRWKNQILENGKQAAFEAAFPELAHNEIMGWEFAAGRLDPVYLLLEAEPEGAASAAVGSAPGATDARPGAALRRGAIAELERAGARCLRVPAFGANTAARLLSHILLADRTSLELASRRGVDPLPVAAITRVKQASRKEGHA
jgi:glucose/mannose-6-phosphate isomerase